MKEKACCFIGHQIVNDTPELRFHLYHTIQSLIAEEGFNTFLFGSMSGLYPICYEIVTELKQKYPYIRRVYVRCEYPYLQGSYKLQLESQYDATYFYKPRPSTDRADYIDRNLQMISSSQVCIFHYRQRDRIKPKKLLPDGTASHATSGTAIAYQYAVKREKRIINMAHLVPVAKKQSKLPPPRRKPGTGSIRRINAQLWEGKFSPVGASGKRIIRRVRAETRAECEIALAALIAATKAEIAAAKKEALPL